MALGKNCNLVRDCMEPAKIVSIEDSFFSAITMIAEYDYVLVRSPDNKVCGIITASDFNDQFRKLAEPFLLVGEIENGVRKILHGRFSAAELKRAKSPKGDPRTIGGISDLTFGEYIRLIQFEEHWKKLDIAIDRVEFVFGLERVRDIRNDVMHFDPDGLEDPDLDFLRAFALFLKRLRDLGAG